ncbi:hypothetical protein KC980_01560, partial [candidate division WWE3 bacterium]|nr:hypothetical protein [candidate division WWE3 bacterium]
MNHRKELTPRQKIIIAFGMLLAIFALLYFGSPETRPSAPKPATTAEENLYKLKKVDRIAAEEDYMVMTEALLRKQVDPEAVPREYWAINMMWDDDLKPIPQIPKEKFEYWAE